MEKLKNLFSATLVKISIAVALPLMALPDGWKMVAASVALFGAGLGLAWPKPRFQRLFEVELKLIETRPRFQFAHAFLMGVFVGALLTIIIGCVATARAPSFYAS